MGTNWRKEKISGKNNLCAFLSLEKEEKAEKHRIEMEERRGNIVRKAKNGEKEKKEVSNKEIPRSKARDGHWYPCPAPVFIMIAVV